MCATAGCSSAATVLVTFIDGRKLRYCSKCAGKIGGEQRPVE